MGTYWPTLLRSRLLYDSDRSGIAADDTDVTGWAKTSRFIVATQIGYNAKDTAASTYKLQWRDVTGTFADVASTGKIKWAATSSVLVDNTSLASGNARCTAPGDQIWQNGYENVGDNLLPDSGTLDLGSDYYTELQWALDPADADNSAQYEFRLWNNTQASAVGVCLAQLTIVAGAQQYYVTGTESVSLSDIRFMFSNKGPFLESITLSDLLEKAKTFVRIFTDTINLSDPANIFTKTFRRTLSDTINLSHVVSKVVNKIRSDSITLTDNITKAASFVKTFLENITLSAQTSTLKMYARILSDTIDISDSAVAFIKAFKRTISDTITNSDQVSKIGTFLRTLSDTITQSDQITAVKSFFRTFSESISLGDNLYAIKAYFRTLSETIDLSDNFSRVASWLRTLPETIILSSQMSAVKAFFRTLSDTITLSDTAITVQKMFSRILQETIDLTDWIEAKLTLIQKLLEETITLADSIRKSASKTFSDALSLSDTINVLKAVLRTFTETVNLTETFRKFPKIVKTQTISLTDVLRRYLNKKALSETITLTQQTLGVKKMFTRIIQETITLTDVLRRLPKKLISNTITLSESLRKAVVKAAIVHTITLSAQTFTGTVYKRFLSDTINITDSLSRLIDKIVSDTINLADNVSKQSILNKVLTETITVIDSIIVLLNPLIERVFTEIMTLTDSKLVMPIKNLLETINLTDSFRVLFKIVGYRLAKFVRAYNMGSFIRSKYEAVFGAIRRIYK